MDCGFCTTTRGRVRKGECTSPWMVYCKTSVKWRMIMCVDVKSCIRAYGRVSGWGLRSSRRAGRFDRKNQKWPFSLKGITLFMLIAIMQFRFPITDFNVNIPKRSKAYKWIFQQTSGKYNLVKCNGRGWFSLFLVSTICQFCQLSIVNNVFWNITVFDIP